MSEIPSYEDIRRERISSFADAPELRARREPRPKPATEESPELTAAKAETAEARAQLAEYEQAAAAAYENQLDTLAYQTDIDEVDDPFQVADALLAASANDPGRLQHFYEQWAEDNPSTASMWLDDRQARVTQAQVAETHAALAAERRQDAEARAKIATKFVQKHGGDELAVALAETVGESTASAEQLAQSLEGAYQQGVLAEKARLQTEAVREVRDSFRDPSAAGSSALNKRTGERRGAPVPEASTDEIVARMPPPADVQKGQREQAMENFRGGFSAEIARAKHSPGARS